MVFCKALVTEGLKDIPQVSLVGPTPHEGQLHDGLVSYVEKNSAMLPVLQGCFRKSDSSQHITFNKFLSLIRCTHEMTILAGSSPLSLRRHSALMWILNLLVSGVLYNSGLLKPERLILLT